MINRYKCLISSDLDCVILNKAETQTLTYPGYYMITLGLGMAVTIGIRNGSIAYNTVRTVRNCATYVLKDSDESTHASHKLHTKTTHQASEM